MNDLEKKINADLKTAMLAKDHQLTDVLRMMKSAILYGGVDSGNRGELSDEEVIKILRKEAKKRIDAAAAYKNANETERYEKELYEKVVIERYLPKMMDEAQVEKLVQGVIDEFDNPSLKDMGKIISEVMKRSSGLTDGGTVARIVKGKING